MSNAELSNKVMVNLRLPKYLWDKTKETANTAGLTGTAFVIMAVRAYLRNWKEDVVTCWESGWPKSKLCPACNKKHDPIEHKSNTINGSKVQLAFEQEGLGDPYNGES